MGDLGGISRECSIELIANEISMQGREVSNLNIRDFLYNIGPLVLLTARWIKRFYLTAFENERFDEISRFELKRKCKLGLCRSKSLPGGIFIVESGIE